MPEGKKLTDYTIVTELKDADGKVVAQGKQQGTAFTGKQFEQEFIIEHPSLWTPDTPALYTAESKIYEGETLKDTYTTRFGVRSVEIIAGKGFFLNGEPLKFRGVCNHHDLGPLGGVSNEAGIRRQIRMLKDMGCNAIRTSHNMPSNELIAACDEMGMMVMAESFDEWKSAKVENGYHKVFDEWVERDLTNLLRHFRNNPSIVMWCIGNEVPDQWNGNRGPKLTRMLQDICHREDPTRPVTQGMDVPDAVVNNNMAAVLDVPGFNYRPHKYLENYKKLPQEIILGSETASTLSSRGVYKFPVERRSMAKYDDIRLLLMTWNTAAGQTCPKTTSSSMTTFLIASVNLYGPDSIIWVNRLLTIQTGPAILLSSVSLTWQDSRKTATTSTAATGTRMQKPCISCPTGTGKDAKEKLLRSLSIPTILRQSCSSTARARENVRKISRLPSKTVLTLLPWPALNARNVTA